MWNLKAKTKTKEKLIDTGNRLVGARGRRFGGMSDGVKRYKFLVIKQLSYGDTVYNMATVVNNTVLHVKKF